MLRNLMLFIFLVPAGKPFLLIVIKPTRDGDETMEPLQVSSINCAATIKEANFLFVDTDCKQIHSCDNNLQAVKKAMQYLNG